MVVWREAGNWGPAGSWTANHDLGTHTIPELPEVGDVLQIRGDDYRVTQVNVGYLYVRPMRQIIS